MIRNMEEAVGSGDAIKSYREHAVEQLQRRNARQRGVHRQIRPVMIELAEFIVHVVGIAAFGVKIDRALNVDEVSNLVDVLFQPRRRSVPHGFLVLKKGGYFCRKY